MKAKQGKLWVADLLILLCFAILGASLGMLIILILTINDPWFPKGWLIPVMLTLLFLCVTMGTMIPLTFAYRNKVLTTTLLKGGKEQ